MGDFIHLTEQCRNIYCMNNKICMYLINNESNVFTKNYVTYVRKLVNFALFNVTTKTPQSTCYPFPLRKMHVELIWLLHVLCHIPLTFDTEIKYIMHFNKKKSQCSFRYIWVSIDQVYTTMMAVDGLEPFRHHNIWNHHADLITPM